MKIAYHHYLRPDDGALLHVRQFSDAARALGHDVEVRALNLAPPDPRPGARAAGALRARAFLKRVLGRYLHEPKELLWNPLYVRKERRLLSRARPDVLLVRDHLITASCLRVARSLSLPLVLEMNAPAVESPLYLDEYWHLPFVPGYLEGRKLREADAVTVVSSALRDHLVERYRLLAAKFVVNPNGVDLSLFRPDREPDPEFRARDGAVVVGFVGSFSPWHGGDLLARLVVEVLKARRDVRFVLVGDGPDRSLVERATSGLVGRVTFTGRLPHARVPSVVAAFDVAVTPEAAFYQSPLKVPEWMAAGRAIVAPGYGPLREIIADGVEGLLFAPRDLGALVAAVLCLVDDPALRRRLGDAAAERARLSLSWEENARRVVRACEESVRRTGDRRPRRRGGDGHVEPVKPRNNA